MGRSSCGLGAPSLKLQEAAAACLAYLSAAALVPASAAPEASAGAGAVGSEPGAASEGRAGALEARAMLGCLVSDQRVAAAAARACLRLHHRLSYRFSCVD